MHGLEDLSGRRRLARPLLNSGTNGLAPCPVLASAPGREEPRTNRTVGCPPLPNARTATDRIVLSSALLARLHRVGSRGCFRMNGQREDFSSRLVGRRPRGLRADFRLDNWLGTCTGSCRLRPVRKRGCSIHPVMALFLAAVLVGMGYLCDCLDVGTSLQDWSRMAAPVPARSALRSAVAPAPLAVERPADADLVRLPPSVTPRVPVIPAAL